MRRLTKELAREVTELETPTDNARQAKRALAAVIAQTEKSLARSRRDFEKDFAKLPKEPTSRQNARELEILHRSELIAYAHVYSALDFMVRVAPGIERPLAAAGACDELKTSFLKDRGA